MQRNMWRLGVGLMVVLGLGACGQAETSGTGGAAPGANATAMPDMDHGNMPGMNATATADAGHSGMDHGAGTTATTAGDAGMGGMDHGTMGTATSSAPYDAQFIDSMIEHHTGAITMAKQAQLESQRPEIKQLAETIIRDQQKEIDQMKAWREQWYPGLPPTGGMGMSMGDMEVGGDASQPFDQRFITAMVAHHNGAIEMARDAQTKAEHPELKQLAEAIIKAQEAEVQQLQAWGSQWFGG